MTLWGSVTIGGFTFREEWSVSQAGSSLALTGEESAPRASTQAFVEAAHHNVTQLGGLVVPVIFTEKEHLSGFYQVADASSELFEREGFIRASWQATLQRVGSGSDVEIESRVPTVARSKDHATTPVYWHAAASGYTSYHTGTTVPNGSVIRSSADGGVIAHLGIPTSVAPRWTIPVGNYLNGSARLLVDGQRRIGTGTPTGGTWEIHNGITRLRYSAHKFDLAVWSGTAWVSETEFVVTGVPTTVADDTVLRNDPEEVTVRRTYEIPTGRATLDLSLRRGSRFVTGVIKRHSAATLGVARTTAEAADAVTGGIRATAADAAGNKYVVGSSKTVTTDLTNGSISKASVTALDFFVGHQVGATPAAGDAYLDLLAQFLGTTGGERVTVVRR